MTAFPNLLTVAPSNPLVESIEFLTLATEYESGQQATKQKRLFPRRGFKVQYNNRSLAGINTLFAFFLGRKGKHLPFNYFNPVSFTYAGEYVGTGTGSAATFNLPSKNATAKKVYVAAVEIAAGGYTFTDSGGEDGADKIVFATPPAAGAYITFDFTGFLKVRCKFADDLMSFEIFKKRLCNTGLDIKGLLNA